MRKTFALGFVVLSMLVLGACSQSENDYPPIYHSMTLATHYQTLSELKSDSDLIAEVQLTGDTSQTTYENANFTITKANVKKVISGDPSFDKQNIDILEITAFNMNQINSNGKYVLFLSKYVGPVQDDVFVVTGVYQGKFNITDNGKIQYDADKYDGINTFQKELNNKKLEEFEELINNT